MYRYLVGFPIVCGLILGILHAVVYQNLKAFFYQTLPGHPFLTSLIASILISTTALFMVYLLFLLVWRSWNKRARLRIREYYWKDIETLIDWLPTFRSEINNEITLADRLGQNGQQRLAESLERLRLMFDLVTTTNNLFRVNITIERYLHLNMELSGLRELRGVIKRGFERTKEILSSHEKNVSTIHRAEEILSDTYYHLMQLERDLAEV